MDRQLAGSLGGSAIGATLGGVFDIISNKMNENAEKRAREENFAYNEQAAENADARTRALYSDLYSPAAKIEQMKEAGLNPNLMYGMNGAAGVGGTSSTTGAMGGGTTGIAPHERHFAALESALMAAQVQKTQAETKNIESDTDIKNTTAENLQEQIDAKLKLMDAQTQEAWSKAGLNKKVTEMQIMANEVFEKTKDTQVKITEKQLDSLTEQVKEIKAETEKLGAEKDQIEKLTQPMVDYYINQAKNALADSEYKTALKGLTSKQAEYIQKEIDAYWQHLNNESLEAYAADTNAQANKTRANIEKELSGVQKGTMIANSIIGAIQGAAMAWMLGGKGTVIAKEIKAVRPVVTGFQ